MCGPVKVTNAVSVALTFLTLDAIVCEVKK